MSVEFIILSEAGVLESQAILLCESIRKFGGRYARAEIVVITPRSSRRPSQDTYQRLELLDAHIVEMAIESPCPEYGVSFKVLACAAHENASSAECLVFLDSDTVFLGEPDLALRGADVAARPVDVKGMCTSGGGDSHDPYWRQLCQLCGVDYDALPSLQTTVDKITVKASYNGGLTVTRRVNGLFQLTADYFLKSVITDLRPWRGSNLEMIAGHGRVSKEGSEFWGSSQACLSLAASALGLSVQILSPNHNFPLHCYDKLRPDIEAGRVSAIVHAHYHGMFGQPAARNPMLERKPGFPPEGIEWLIQRAHD